MLSNAQVKRIEDIYVRGLKKLESAPEFSLKPERKKKSHSVAPSEGLTILPLTVHERKVVRGFFNR
jgi:hypothetical protein